jgi:hypothetical protein
VAVLTQNDQDAAFCLRIQYPKHGIDHGDVPTAGGSLELAQALESTLERVETPWL